MSDHPIHTHLLTGCAVKAIEYKGERGYLLALASGDELRTDFLVNQQGIETLQRQIDTAQCAHLAAKMDEG